MFSAGEPSQPLSQAAATKCFQQAVKHEQTSSQELQVLSGRTCADRRFHKPSASLQFSPKSGLFHQKFGLWRLLSCLTDSICRLTSVERSTSRQELKPSRHLFTRDLWAYRCSTRDRQQGASPSLLELGLYLNHSPH